VSTAKERGEAAYKRIKRKMDAEPLAKEVTSADILLNERAKQERITKRKQGMKRVQARKEREDAILSTVRVPPVVVSVRDSADGMKTDGGSFYDEVLELHFDNKHDAAEKLRNLAHLLVCSHGAPSGGGTIYVGLRRAR
jgi:hypothetical protein